ncbi:hypothetical protein M413DRAFT_445516 [Hebeloma cylindrosporum]|uniref:Uncharacterized protein n=1 Tax=Hebeloma cylindrosporum TaxID=76867 RepID=A0A0C2XV50_HEBCY|nr:hypothetical protein M413DRAFT_445516 [Hebeloma cylindrosporum h7]
MEALPIDTSHPAVQDYLALVRLQVLTPLSLLINIAAVVVCTFLATRSIAGVSRLYPTSITPNAAAIGAYVAVIYLGQIGYCLLLVFASKPETKKALTHGVGLSLVFANFVMALWAISWVMQWFILSTVLQGILLLLLIFSNMALLIYHPPVSSRPLDTALIHAPLRFFLVLPLNILFSLCLFVTLHLTYHPNHPGPASDYTTGFGVLIGTNLVGLAVIIARRDIVWCVAATWIVTSLWIATPKPAIIYITAIIFTALHPLGLVLSMIYARFYSSHRPNRRIVLPGDEGGHPGLYRGAENGNTQGQAQGVERGPREVEEENWG